MANNSVYTLCSTWSLFILVFIQTVVTSCFKKEKESYLPCFHIEGEKSGQSLMSFESDTRFLFRKVQVQAGCGSSSFIVSFNEYFKILHASNCTASVTLISSCFLNKCKTDGKRKPVHRVSPVRPHSVWSYFCLLYPNYFLTRISSILVRDRWNTNCLYKQVRLLWQCIRYWT